PSLFDELVERRTPARPERIVAGLERAQARRSVPRGDEDLLEDVARRRAVGADRARLSPADDRALHAAPEFRACIEREHRAAADLLARDVVRPEAHERLLEPCAVIDVLRDVEREIRDLRVGEARATEAR